MLVGPSIGTPNILNLYLNAVISSTAFFMAVNYDPNVDVSTQFCLLLYHIMGALFTNMRIPVIDLLVVLFLA